MRDLQGILKQLEFLIEDLHLNTIRSPWSKKQGIFGWLSHLQGEVGELRDAMLKEDKAHIEEEMGDVFWNCITLALYLQAEGYLNIEMALCRAIIKLRGRKPWIFTRLDQEITMTAEEEHAEYLANKERLKAQT